jgi:DNA replication protein DnaC
MGELQEQAIRQHCKVLRMPTIGSQFARLADAAVREKQSHVGYLEALLAAEMEERESRAIARLLHEARRFCRKVGFLGFWVLARH